MKLKHLYSVMIILLSIGMYTWAQQGESVLEEYCIIQGDNVRMRAQPTVKAKVVGKVEKYEFVYCIGKTEEKTKIDADEDYWYKIRNCDTTEGWVFGKYVWDIDDDKKHGEYFKKIIKYEMINNGYCRAGVKNRIYKLNNESNHYIIDFESGEKVKMGNEYGTISVGLLIFYKTVDDQFVKVIENMGKRNYFFYNKKYIIIYSKNGIDIYNINTFKEKQVTMHYDILCKYYAGTGFYLRKDVISKIEECNTDWDTRLNCISYSEMEFNPETMEVVVYIRKEKGKLLKQEKYKFKDGVFVKID